MEQAEALADFIDSLHDQDVLIIGDLNAYGEEDPIDVLEAAGYVDLVDTRLAEADQYSYVFQGQASYLDHALVSERLARRVAGVDIWHVNADDAVPRLQHRVQPRRVLLTGPVPLLRPRPGPGRAGGPPGSPAEARPPLTSGLG